MWSSEYHNGGRKIFELNDNNLIGVVASNFEINKAYVTSEFNFFEVKCCVRFFFFFFPSKR